MSEPPASNAAILEQELRWLELLIDRRLSEYIGGNGGAHPRVTDPPPLEPGDSFLGTLVAHYEMGAAERALVALGLAPYVRPQILDPFFTRRPDGTRGFTELGGVQGRLHGGFLPTGETALFLLAGVDLESRFAYQSLFDRSHYFAQHDLLKLEPVPRGEPPLSGQIVLSDHLVDLLTTGRVRKPEYGRDFPARLLTTELEWDEVVLAPGTREQIRELEYWVRHSDELMNGWELGRRLRPGYRCLFHGPPGTGKTLTATLLGKRVGRDVYRIALSSVVSKYIGETEKNLERVFDRAEGLGCILFFDEADALFGKRTAVSDAHDRYANQEVSFLLQRVEDYAGLVILASNFASNIDDAFTRRFQSVVHFPMPTATERRRLWTESFSPASVLEEDIEVAQLAEEYELSGGAVMNVVRYASLMALEAGTKSIRRVDLIRGIRRELQKDGKTF